MKFRMQELQSLIGLADQTIKELSQEEWDLMTPAEKLPFYEIANNEKLQFELKKDQIQEIGVDSFMSSIKEARKQKDVLEEFKEDHVLSILNHKKKWKQTWTRKKKEALRLQKTLTPIQIKKAAKLKLN